MKTHVHCSDVLRLLCVILVLLPLVQAHSYLINPEPYNIVWKTTRCEGSECNQACPSVWPRGMKNSIKKPAKIFRRGDKFTLKWTKNNHHGGMLRVSIVPAHVMMSRRWQRRLAIYYGCWEQGMYHCRPGEECGADNRHEAFSRKDFEIPDIYPDGKYVMSAVWYGGLHFKRDRGQFADYYSCSFIEIRGGTLGYSFQPFWDSGDTGKYKNDKMPGMCQTAADWVGKCGNRGCGDSRPHWGMQKEFKKGGKPLPVTKTDVIEAIKDGEKDKWMLEQKGKEAGLCSSIICCPKSCGVCGGSNCNQRPGGGENCCTAKIMSSGRSCDVDMPPCKVRTR